MKSGVLVLGIDPGFASLGVALVRCDGGRPLVEAADVIRTAPSARKAHVLGSEDNVRRCRSIAEDLTRWMHGAHLVGAESMSFPRNASAAYKVGLTWGIITVLAERHGAGIVQASPQAVKAATAGSKTASKLDVQAAVERMADYSDAASKTLREQVPGSEREHAYDAIAAAVTALNSDAARAVIRATRAG